MTTTVSRPPAASEENDGAPSPDASGSVSHASGAPASGTQVSGQVPGADAESLAVLLAKCGNGDVHAFDQLYAATSSRLYGLALRMLRDPESAEDVLQEAYLRIWDKAANYDRSLGEPLTWMCSIARYRALDQLRRRKYRENAQRPLDEEAFADSVDGDSAQSRHDDGELLQRCLERLKPEARSCVVLAFCEGYSHEELSERFTTPLGTVKSWIRRGVASLRSCIDELA